MLATTPPLTPSAPTTAPPVIETRAIRKTYGEKVAVDDISFRMPPDAILGLLGPNGAGKTSLIRMLTTITRPDAGQVLFNGEPLNGFHPTQIGYLPEERGLYKQMYVGEQLLYLAQLKGMAKKEAETRARRWLDVFELAPQWGKQVEELSKGMQQQVQFIATVLHEPKLLILDEPFSGLDPVNATRMRTEILRLHAQGTAVIFSTHRMEQVEELCEYIVLVNQGKKILEGRVKDIRQAFRDFRYRLDYRGTLPPAATEGYATTHPRPGTVEFQLNSLEEGDQLLRHLLRHEVGIENFQALLPSLNEVFIKQVTPQDQRSSGPPPAVIFPSPTPVTAPPVSCPSCSSSSVANT